LISAQVAHAPRTVPEIAPLSHTRNRNLIYSLFGMGMQRVDTEHATGNRCKSAIPAITRFWRRTTTANHSGQPSWSCQRAKGRFQSWPIGSWFGTCLV